MKLSGAERLSSASLGRVDAYASSFIRMLSGILPVAGSAYRLVSYFILSRASSSIPSREEMVFFVLLLWLMAMYDITDRQIVSVVRSVIFVFIRESVWFFGVKVVFIFVVGIK